jgi:hypothetical protein
MKGVFTTAIAAFLLTCFALPAQSYAADYIWCQLRNEDSNNKTVYYSEVFPGNYLDHLTMQNAFTAYVHGNYDKVIGIADCLFKSDQSSARTERDSSKATERTIGRSITQTNWTP